MTCGELAYQEQRGADVLAEKGVDFSCGQLGEATVAAASVIDDEDVERPDRLVGRGHDLLGDIGIGEIGFGERHPQVPSHRFRAPGLRAPWLGCIVLRPALNE